MNKGPADTGAIEGFKLTVNTPVGAGDADVSVTVADVQLNGDQVEVRLLPGSTDGLTPLALCLGMARFLTPSSLRAKLTNPFATKQAQLRAERVAEFLERQREYHHAAAQMGPAAAVSHSPVLAAATCQGRANMYRPGPANRRVIIGAAAAAAAVSPPQLNPNRTPIPNRVNRMVNRDPPLPGGTWQSTSRHSRLLQDHMGWILEARLQKRNGRFVRATTRFVPGDRFANDDGRFRYLPVYSW